MKVGKYYFNATVLAFMAYAMASGDDYAAKLFAYLCVGVGIISLAAAVAFIIGAAYVCDKVLSDNRLLTGAISEKIAEMAAIDKSGAAIGYATSAAVTFGMYRTGYQDMATTYGVLYFVITCPLMHGGRAIARNAMKRLEVSV